MDQDSDQLIDILPILDEDIWGPLQSGGFDVAAVNLCLLLEQGFKPQDWTVIQWGLIIEGIPIVRGRIDEATWERVVRRFVGWAIIRAVHENSLAYLYSSLLPNDFALCHQAILSGMDGQSPAERTKWLSGRKPEALDFYLSNPGGFRIDGNKNLLAPAGKARFETLPENIKDTILSVQTTRSVFDACEQNKIPKERMSLVADVCGQILLGFIRMSDLSLKLHEQTGLDIRVCKDVSAVLESKIFNGIRADLDKIYAPPSAEPAKMGDIKPVAGGVKQGAQPVRQNSIFEAPKPPARADFIKDIKRIPIPMPTVPTMGTKPDATIRSVAIPTSPRPAQMISPEPPKLPTQAIIKPINTSNFKLDIKTATTSYAQVPTTLNSNKGVQIELGTRMPTGTTASAGVKTVPTPTPVITPPAPPRIVHYSQLKTPLSPLSAPTSEAKTPLASAPVPIHQLSINISGAKTDRGITPEKTVATTNPKPLPPPPPRL